MVVAKGCVWGKQRATDQRKYIFSCKTSKFWWPDVWHGDYSL